MNKSTTEKTIKITANLTTSITTIEFTIITLGKNPIKGGNPPSERIVIKIKIEFI